MQNADGKTRQAALAKKLNLFYSIHSSAGTAMKLN